MTVPDPREGWGRQRFRRRQLRILTKIVGSLAVGVGSLGYSYLVEPFWVEVTRTTVQLPNLPPAFEGLRLLLIADTHYGWRVGDQQMERVIALANRQRADVICLLGDYVTRRAGYTFPYQLADLRANSGIFAVLGNHDYFGNQQRNSDHLRECGATVLRNAGFVLERAGQRLYFAGVEDIRQHDYDLRASLRDSQPNDCRILLAHNPDFIDRLGDQRIDLMLCGHTHGGQVLLPFFGTPHLPLKHEELLRGLYRVGKTQVYVNRGIGMSGIPHRLRARPEISVLRLTH